MSAKERKAPGPARGKRGEAEKTSPARRERDDAKHAQGKKKTRDAAPSQRQLRVAEEIRHVLAGIFARREFRDPELAEADITVSEVRLSPDVWGDSSDVPINAWIERDDPPRDSTAGQPRFLDQFPDDERNTLSSLSTGKNTLVASGFNRMTGSVAPYASQGAVGGKLPHVLAACEEDEMDPTIAAAATRSGEVYRINGTSVAAPVLARRLYNHMVRLGKQKVPETVARDEWPKVISDLAAKDPALKPYVED